MMKRKRNINNKEQGALHKFITKFMYILTLYNIYSKHIFSERIEKIQWKIQTLHIDFSPGNPN
jgi:hypothetical protein